jgi:hypothetical protein
MPQADMADRPNFNATGLPGGSFHFVLHTPRRITLHRMPLACRGDRSVSRFEPERV